MRARNRLKIRHYIVGFYAIRGIIGTIFVLITGRTAATLAENIAGHVFYPIAFLLLLASVIAYSLKKEKLSKILVSGGLGILAFFILIGTVLYIIAGEFSVFPSVFAFFVLVGIALLFWVFLRK